ncbi:MAG: hypothetical protein GY952_16470 [Rhodobacteraceae bacterium]|nr:hypothetical protein [Paracoccaceae bacterium]
MFGTVGVDCARTGAPGPPVWVASRAAIAIIDKASRSYPADYDEEMYKWRHLAENFFQKIKDNRGIATRCCKTDTSFAAFISLAATILWLR